MYRKRGSNFDPDSSGGKPQNLGAVPYSERESDLDKSRLATFIARTNVTCAVLPQESLQAYFNIVSDKKREVVFTTMGSSSQKNLKAVPFLKVFNWLINLSIFYMWFIFYFILFYFIYFFLEL